MKKPSTTSAAAPDIHGLLPGGPRSAIEWQESYANYARNYGWKLRAHRTAAHKGSGLVAYYTASHPATRTRLFFGLDGTVRQGTSPRHSALVGSVLSLTNIFNGARRSGKAAIAEHTNDDVPYGKMPNRERHFVARETAKTLKGYRQEYESDPRTTGSMTITHVALEMNQVSFKVECVDDKGATAHSIYLMLASCLANKTPITIEVRRVNGEALHSGFTDKVG